VEVTKYQYLNLRELKSGAVTDARQMFIVGMVIGIRGHSNAAICVSRDHAQFNCYKGKVMDKPEIKEAMAAIKQAMIDDNPSEPGSYAHSWHCNIAMACYDACASPGLPHGEGHKKANEAASRFMKLCFDVETKG